MEHYYSNEPTVKSEKREFEYNLDDDSLSFKTDNGVFSKSFIDYGSRVLIDSVDFPLEGNVLDLGCGYGAIGIIIAKKNPKSQITMADVNKRALELAKENAISNDVKNVKVIESDIYSNVTEKYNYILTNPPIRAGKKVVHEFLEGAYEKLLDNGEIFVVIQKKQGAPSAKAKLEEVFGNCEILNRDKGYYILNSRKVK